MWYVCNKVTFCACFKIVFRRPSFSMFLLKLYETTPSTEITNGQMETLSSFQMSLICQASSSYLILLLLFSLFFFFLLHSCRGILPKANIYVQRLLKCIYIFTKECNISPALMTITRVVRWRLKNYYYYSFFLEFFFFIIGSQEEETLMKVMIPKNIIINK